MYSGPNVRLHVYPVLLPDGAPLRVHGRHGVLGHLPPTLVAQLPRPQPRAGDEVLALDGPEVRVNPGDADVGERVGARVLVQRGRGRLLLEYNLNTAFMLKV